MKPVLVFKTLFRRRMILVGAVSVLLIVSTVVVATNIFHGVRKTKAAFCDGALPKNCTVDSISISISDTDTTYDGSNLTVTNSTIIIAGTHTFNNLTLDSSIITHQPLVAGTDFSLSNNSNLTASGAVKKIDIKVNSSLVLKNGSSLNADGKGYPLYPAGNVSGNNRAYGNLSGGGGNSYGIIALGSFVAGGGGNGGQGGSLFNRPNVDPGDGVSGLAYGYTLPDYYPYPGSAGGSAKTLIPAYQATGGTGGGRINLETSSLNIESGNVISANGGNAGACVSTFLSQPVCGSGGAGGTIIIKAGTIETAIDPKVVGGLGSSINGYAGLLYLNNVYSLNSSTNITANGGAGGSGGGGGVIEIIATKSNYKIFKWLESVEQPNQAEPINPYTLQLGDAIKVKIKVDEIQNGSKIDDAILQKPNGGAYCLPRQGTINLGGIYSTASRKVHWDYGQTASSAIFEYICDVGQLLL